MAKERRKMERVRATTVSFVMPRSSAMYGSAGAMMELLSGVTNV